jgi:asparagine synthase (glutamine-hydrolysing)
MCGIAGIMTTHDVAPKETLRAMTAALAHRGPDGQGAYAHGDTAFMQTRLAIIDLKTGDQPLYGPDNLALVANGEIYNYVELRAAMPEVKFATQSDCEPALYLYRRHGVDFARHLRGMYAIALHDPRFHRLVLARDAFGIKPLYYLETARGVAFASEPKALLTSGLIEPNIIREKRDELLQLQFTTGRDTIFAGIERVLPGETLVIEKGRIVEHHRLEALPDGAPPDPAALDRVWEDSIRVHQRADVPYGMFLSGGIDSSAVLAMMARLNPRPVKAFTIGFSGTAARDERELARRVAQAFGAEHTDIDFSESDFWKDLPAVARAMDDPAADYAIMPTWKLARTAHEAGLKVILSGEGGDELFGGYGRYRSAMRPWWRGGRRMRRRGTFDGLGILRSTPGWRYGMIAAERAAKRPGRSRLQQAQAVDCADWLPNDLLAKLDRCLMAHAVEGRTPFLDREVAAFAFNLPDSQKIRNGLGKHVLREWVAKYAPAAEPFSKKRGFTVPVGEWIAARGTQLGPLVAKQECIREIARPGTVEGLFANASHKRAGFAAWTLLFYALWHRQHVEHHRFENDTFSALSES